MKKTILTTIVALFCLSASAQFRVMSDINTPEEDSTWSVNNFTNNLGVGYQVNEEVMIGLQKNGEDYDFIGRYSLNDDMYLSVQAPTENLTDNMTFGIGTSIKVWEELYVEPNYTTKDGEGSFNVGLSYKL
jgi:hypothetical protein|tara:strand:+ start:432 stop:824 length:393 start_codon:yes stop_codon:yes gene_type:complete